MVEVGVVVYSINTGPQTEADPPGPGHGHSEDACNETNVKKRVIQLFVNFIPVVISRGVTDTSKFVS